MIWYLWYIYTVLCILTMNKEDTMLSDLVIRQNKIKTYIYMFCLMLVFGLLGSYISNALKWGLSGTTIFLLVSAIINFIAYFYSDKIIIKNSKARLLDRSDIPELTCMVEQLCSEIKIPVPKLYLVEDRSMNAFATGRNPSHAAIAVTRGLLEKLTPAEIRAVVAHEIAHISNWDTLLMTIISIVAGFISIMSDIFWRSKIINKAQEKDRSGILSIAGILLILFAPIAALLIQLTISRKREFTADEYGARISCDPLSLASALNKISRDRRSMPFMSQSAAHLCFSSPLNISNVLDRIFSTHPPIEERIKKLNALNEEVKNK